MEGPKVESGTHDSLCEGHNAPRDHCRQRRRSGLYVICVGLLIPNLTLTVSPPRRTIEIWLHFFTYVHVTD